MKSEMSSLEGGIMDSFISLYFFHRSIIYRKYIFKKQKMVIENIEIENRTENNRKTLGT